MSQSIGVEQLNLSIEPPSTSTRMDKTSALNLPLAPEVLDLIFYLLRGNNESLEAISQISTVFSKLVERHLYHHIELRLLYYLPGGKWFPAQLSASSSATKLFNLLDKSPHLTSYIESLRIIFEYELGNGYYFEDFPFSLSRLPRLKKINVCIPDEESRLPWTLLPRPFSLALLKHIQSPNIEEICLSSLGSPPIHELSKCDALKRLSLSDIFLFNDPTLDDPILDDPSQPFHCDLRHLQSLDMRDCDPDMFMGLTRYFSLPASPGSIPIPNLRSLHLQISGSSQLRRLTDILKVYSQTLVSLEFDAITMCECHQLFIVITLGAFDINIAIVYTPAELREGNNIDPDSVTLSLADASSLECLTIHTVAASPFTNDSYHNFPETAIPPICRLIRTLPSSSPMRCIRLILKLYTGVSPLKPEIDWSVFEETIISGGLPSSMKVELTVSFDSSESMDEDLEEALTQSARMLREDAVLSRLINRGLLSMNIVTEE